MFQIATLPLMIKQLRLTSIARYGKESHLPVGKSLASFDFAQVPGLAREQIKALAGSSDWTRQARNVLLFGASGVGKTHLGAAIGHGLTEQGVRVRYVATTALCPGGRLTQRGTLICMVAAATTPGVHPKGRPTALSRIKSVCAVPSG